MYLCINMRACLSLFFVKREEEKEREKISIFGSLTLSIICTDF